MAACLRELDPLLRASLTGLERQSILRFADSMELAGSKSIAMVASKVEKQISSRKLERADTLGAPLATVSSALAACGAASLAKEFALVAAMLGKAGSLPPEDLFALVQAALVLPPKKGGAKKVATSKIDLRAAADRLLVASANNASFDELLSELSVLSKKDLEEVAKRYLGYGRSFKSKADVIKSIRSRQLQDAIQESRERRISKIAV